ncbi:MAG: FadR family transcriptional regulator [Clostridia bacterium]|nr:FadR family transcriptional regulator [Clostridia bacterium]
MSENEKATSGKAYEKVVDYIQGEIYSGHLKRGEKLPPERDLAEKLGVGRNSVREALRTLSLMGFISSTQGAGNFVSCDMEKNLTQSTRMMMMMGELTYRQISELRQGLESEAAMLAAERITDEQLAALEDAAWAMREENDVEKSSMLDNRLHQLIGEAAGNPLIMVILRSLAGTIDHFINDMHRRIMADPVLGKRLQDTHQGIVLALRDHNKGEAARVMREHFKVVDDAIFNLETKQ